MANKSLAFLFDLLSLAPLLFVADQIYACAIHLEQIKLPPGFTIAVYTDKVPNARGMTLGKNGTVFVGSWDSYFYAIDASTGRERWRFKTGEDADTHNQVGIQSSAAVVDGMIYFGCRDSHLYALDAKSGEKKWAFSGNGSWVVASPAVREGKVYFATSDTSLVDEVDARSGAVLRSLGLNHWYLYSSPAIAGNTLYVGSTQGKLVAVDLAQFKLAGGDTAGYPRCGVHIAEQLRPFDEVVVGTVGRRVGDRSGQGRRRLLAAGHGVHRIIHYDDEDVLIADGGVH